MQPLSHAATGLTCLSSGQREELQQAPPAEEHLGEVGSGFSGASAGPRGALLPLSTQLHLSRWLGKGGWHGHPGLALASASPLPQAPV